MIEDFSLEEAMMFNKAGASHEIWPMFILGIILTLPNIHEHTRLS